MDPGVHEISRLGKVSFEIPMRIDRRARNLNVYLSFFYRRPNKPCSHPFEVPILFLTIQSVKDNLEDLRGSVEEPFLTLTS